MKETLLTCIEITRNKGILFCEKDLDQAREYVENMLDQEELERILKDANKTLKDINFMFEIININTNDYKRLLKSKEVEEKIKHKLEKQKELLENEM